MKQIKLATEPERRRWALVFDTDDEVIATLQDFAATAGVRAASLSGLGACRRATLAYYDWERKQYQELPVDEQVEVTSLVGDLGADDDGVAVHVHAVLGRRDGSALTGHLLRGTVRPTLEVFVVEGAGELRRRHDPETGLTLIKA